MSNIRVFSGHVPSNPSPLLSTSQAKILHKLVEPQGTIHQVIISPLLAKVSQHYVEPQGTLNRGRLSDQPSIQSANDNA